MKMMVQIIFLSILFLFSASIFATVKSDPIYNEENTTIQVTRQHPEFTIKLKSNPTTGFQWSLREYDTKMITAVKHDYAAPHTKLIGAPGYEEWTFKANPNAFNVPQTLAIHMVYARPWDSSDEGTQITFKVVTRK